MKLKVTVGSAVGWAQKLQLYGAGSDKSGDHAFTGDCRHRLGDDGNNTDDGCSVRTDGNMCTLTDDGASRHLPLSYSLSHASVRLLTCAMRPSDCVKLFTLRRRAVCVVVI